MKYLNGKRVKLGKLVGFVSILFFVSGSILANGNAGGTIHSNAVNSNITGSNSGNANQSSYQQNLQQKKHSVYVKAKMYPGSVRANIQRIAKQYGWKTVVWKSSDDYNWHGLAVVEGSSLSDVMGQILLDYPLQADFYQGNHVLVIQPRTLK